MPWIGFIVDTESLEVEIDPSKQKTGRTLRKAIMGLERTARVSARTLLATASRLNFIQWIAPGGLRRRRIEWNAVTSPV